MTPDGLATIQARLERVSSQLRGIEQDLGELVRALLSGHQLDDDMMEGRKPYDLAAELFTALECLLADYIRPAIELTACEARVTPDTVEHAWWVRRCLPCDAPDL